MSNQTPETTDPQQLHDHPDTKGDQLPPPGSEGSVTSAMSEEPDHGEESYVGTGKLADRVAVITGGDSGIGRAVALAFAREGADVVLAYLEGEDEDGKKTAQLVEDAGRRAVLVPGDLTSEDACQALVDKAVQEFGRIDVLVNNAAYQMTFDGIENLSTEQLIRTYTTNVFAMFWLCRAALPHLGPGSSIINTASIQAFDPSPPLLDYASTKAAIVNFTKNLAQEVAERGIRVNCVAPGPIWTPLIPATMSPDHVEKFGGNTPMERPGQPGEVAPAYVFLASPACASYITGIVLPVTGSVG